MDVVRLRIATAGKALATLRELTGLERPSAIERDAAIQRFEYTCEATWKAAQAWLKAVEGLETASPKSAIRACAQVGVLEPEAVKLALRMIDDRNLTSHTYHEGVAEGIHSRLPEYVTLLTAWLSRLTERS